MALKYKIFHHSYLGFDSNSTLFYGENDAVLIDASMMMSDAYKVVAGIVALRKNLTHIYVSHFHPDHHFGLKALKLAFPDAKIVALHQSVHDIVDTANDKIDMWSATRFGVGELPGMTVIPYILEQPYVELEGEKIEFYGEYEGDSINNSIVWVPSMKVVCATDVAFHDCHLWPNESDAARREIWRKDIARMMDFDPRIVIPGHHDAAKMEILEAAMEDTSITYTDCVDWSIKYLEYYDYVYDTAKTGAELVDLMFKEYDLKAEDFAIHWNARLIFPRTAPDWCTPLPGKRGQIFLNPQGGFDGDPAKEEEE
jgi:glyoxylase-like metal-dependent hydrolase (beta-lactamase superfamily II)